ncbi:MAG: glycosyltransferase [Alphaproteobacteria bacterium]|jgi:hypothetical protein|nr:glycosyltransferase [Alphaproteobacteria bacterium]
MDNKVLQDLSIIVKTFLRPDMLDSFLKSVSDYQKKHNIKFPEVLVGDDSPEEIIEENKKVVAKYPDVNINFQAFEFNIGLAEGRNRLVDIVKTKYFLLCDDDVLLDIDSNFEDVIKVLEKKNLDIYGGWWKNQYNMSTGEYEERGFVAKFIEYDNNLILNVDEFCIPEFAYTHCMMNYFIAKTDIVKKYPWDNEMKTQEHYIFFYEAWKNNVKMAVGKELFAKHRMRTENPTYNLYRNDINKKEYVIKMADKANVKNWDICYFRKGLAVTWSINTEERTSVIKHYKEVIKEKKKKKKKSLFKRIFRIKKKKSA